MNILSEVNRIKEIMGVINERNESPYVRKWYNELRSEILQALHKHKVKVKPFLGLSNFDKLPGILRKYGENDLANTMEEFLNTYKEECKRVEYDIKNPPYEEIYRNDIPNSYEKLTDKEETYIKSVMNNLKIPQEYGELIYNKGLNSHIFSVKLQRDKNIELPHRKMYSPVMFIGKNIVSSKKEKQTYTVIFRETFGMYNDNFIGAYKLNDLYRLNDLLIKINRFN